MICDIASRQDIEAVSLKLDQVLRQLAAPAPAAGPDDLLSIEQVASYTGFERRAVEAWRTEGRFDDKGKRVYLPAYRFSGRLRFKRSDVEAFGLGIGVLKPSPVDEQAVEAVKKSTKKRPAVSSQEALKVA